ncbi:MULTISPECIES: proteasome activator [unclassified Kribbella]|uniref:proteasome activator n=1 Tax=unclassified Kribbella TaxID=2644121 RepID=UPI0030182632
MTTGATRTERRPATSDVTDPVLFIRLFEMLTDVRRELGRKDLDAAARLRAARLLTQARCRFRDALSPAVAAEFERVEPDLTDEPTVAELRLAYRGTLAWLAGLSWLPNAQPPSSTGRRQR